ncbi:L domain-like protein [Piromyces finnis]|uniref:L domain-like protein n=1 Tax=Piromyces finnis TaxID=1754191 RepID=A0A1Y1UY78_9FUNG|nr:L domain-like protein [Piromyces finnis]|eukprot:ORX43298.1 L domain-like protein [Piromyces finnis]
MEIKLIILYLSCLCVFISSKEINKIKSNNHSHILSSEIRNTKKEYENENEINDKNLINNNNIASIQQTNYKSDNVYDSDSFTIEKQSVNALVESQQQLEQEQEKEHDQIQVQEQKEEQKQEQKKEKEKEQIQRLEQEQKKEKEKEQIQRLEKEQKEDQVQNQQQLKQEQKQDQVQNQQQLEQEQKQDQVQNQQQLEQEQKQDQVQNQQQLEQEQKQDQVHEQSQQNQQQLEQEQTKEHVHEQQLSPITQTCDIITTTVTAMITQENTITVTLTEPTHIQCVTTTETVEIPSSTYTTTKETISIQTNYDVSNTSDFIPLNSLVCKNLLNNYFKPNLIIHFDDNITLLTSGEGFIINQDGISDCSENYSLSNTNSDKKLMTYNPDNGLCLDKKCHQIKRVVDFSCNFNDEENNLNKEESIFPTNKTKWFSIISGKEITTYYYENTLVCEGEMCPLSFECTSKKSSGLENITFNYFNQKLMVKPNNSKDVEIFTNNSQVNAVLTIFSGLNIIKTVDENINVCDYTDYITCFNGKFIKLNLSSYEITNDLWGFIFKLEYLEELYLHNCKLTSAFLQSIDRLSHLKVLDVSKNSITNGLKYIAELKNLELLNISNNPITDNIAILEKIKHTLETFNASNTQIKGDINTISNLSNIKKVFLSNSNISGDISVLYIKKRSNIIKKSDYILPHSLTHLDISMTSIKGNINDLFTNPCNLEYINISNTQIIGSIPSNLYQCQNLKSINLSNTPVIGEISPDIKNLTKLKEIILSSTDINNINLEYFMTMPDLEIINISQTKTSGIIPEDISKLKKLIVFDIHSTKIEGYVPNDFFNLNTLNIVDLSNTFLCGGYNEDVCGMNSKMDGSIRTIPSCKVNINMCNNCSFCPTTCNPIIFKYTFMDWNNYEEVSFEKDVYNPSRVLCKGSTYTCPVSYYFCVSKYNMDNNVNKIHFNTTTGNIEMNTYANFINTESLLEPMDESILQELHGEINNNENSSEAEKDIMNFSSNDDLITESPTQKEMSKQIIQEKILELNNESEMNLPSKNETDTNLPMNESTNPAAADNDNSNPSNQTEQNQTNPSNDKDIEYYKNYYKNYYNDYYKNESDQKVYKIIALAVLICWALGLFLFIVWILIKHNDSNRYGRKSYDFLLLIPAAIISFPFSIIFMFIYYCVTTRSPCLPKYDVDLIIEMGQNSEAFKNFIQSRTPPPNNKNNSDQKNNNKDNKQPVTKSNNISTPSNKNHENASYKNSKYTHSMSSVNSSSSSDSSNSDNSSDSSSSSSSTESYNNKKTSINRRVIY